VPRTGTGWTSHQRPCLAGVERRPLHRAELGTPEIGSDLAVADRNGLSSVLEYACNRDPRQPDTTPAFTFRLVTVNGSPTFEVTFQWTRFASDLTFAFEASADLQSWNPVAAILVDSTALDAAAGHAAVRISVASMPDFIGMAATRCWSFPRP
jgi:hypothetical protein